MTSLADFLEDGRTLLDLWCNAWIGGAACGHTAQVPIATLIAAGVPADTAIERLPLRCSACGTSRQVTARFSIVEHYHHTAGAGFAAKDLALVPVPRPEAPAPSPRADLEAARATGGYP